MLVEATDCFLTRLVKGDLPIHLIQKVIVNNDEDGTHAKLERSSALIVCITFVKGITALVCLRNWAKDAKVVDLKGLLL